MHLAKKYLLPTIFYCLLNTAQAASNEPLWQDHTNIAARSLAENITLNTRGVSNARQLTLNVDAMESLLIPSHSGNNIHARSLNLITVELPLPNGSNVTLSLESTDILAANLAEKFADIKTYKVAEASGDIISGRVDFTQHGFHAMLQTFDGQTLFIDPASKDKTDNYISYSKNDQSNRLAFIEGKLVNVQHGANEDSGSLQSRTAARTRSNEGVVEYRIAIAATAEYTQLQGGTVGSALSAMVTTLNRVNHVYEQSLGIRLSLVENNDQLIYTDISTDPYSNYNIENMLAENQRNLDDIIGSENYDIGHVFGTSGGGLAYIGSVCRSSSKARGASGIRNPNNDSFDIDYVAHEIGHQFGATHTFNSNQGICTSGARTARSAFEPGSGSSIMSYVGGCGTDDLQHSADAMFHSGNIEQINKNVLTGAASACGIVHETNNSAPMAIAGNSYTIPANTPFLLTAKAADADNDVLQYSWEQIDTGPASALKIDTGQNPLFRILPPTKDSTRTFPAMSTILGEKLVKGETLPNTDRTMNFQLAVYDGHHVPSLDRVNINVVNTGEAFKLHDSTTQYRQNSTATVSWNTANTQSLPINCTSVDLSLSTNGGKTFDEIIAKSIPNDGSASVFIPKDIISTGSGRFKLSCTNNIFFSISSSNFTIGQNVQPVIAGPRTGNNSNMAEVNVNGGGGSMGITLFMLLLAINVFRTRSHS